MVAVDIFWVEVATRAINTQTNEHSSEYAFECKKKKKQTFAVKNFSVSRREPANFK